MGPKERNYNPVAAQQKKDKSKQKQRAKETLKNSFTTQNLQKELRSAEQELTQFLSSNTDLKLATSATFQGKLGKVNDVRIKLDLPTKTPDDYIGQYKEIKRQLKSLKSGVSRKDQDMVPQDAATSIVPADIEIAVPEKEKLVANFDQRDLSGIKIPSGVAPETEGQMYNGLSQLRVVKCSKVLMRKRLAMAAQIQKKQDLASIPPPPPPITDTALPFPAYLPIPTFTGASQVPTFPVGMQMPFPPPPVQSFANYSVPPPPPSIANHLPPHLRTSEKEGAGRLYASSSHAKAPTNDPLAPEINEAPERVAQEQKSQLVYGSKPQIRDFKKEVTGFVPAALLRKKK